MGSQRIGQNLVTEQQQQQQDIRRLTDVENRIVVAKGEEAKGGVDWEAGVGTASGMFAKMVMFKESCEGDVVTCAFLVRAPSRWKQRRMGSPLVAMWLRC